jgi:MoxR-like ATPase
MLCGLSLPEVAQGVGISRHAVWKLYTDAGRTPSAAVSTYLTQEFQARVTEAEQLTKRFERLMQMSYDPVERIEQRSYTGPVFGLTVPTSRSYIAGFGACGISHNTFMLPEAQLDRFFFKIFVGYPSSDELSRILRQTTTAETISLEPLLPAAQVKDWVLNARHLVREVLVARPVEDYVVRLVTATRPAEEGAQDAATRWLRYGASPRGAQAILLGAKVAALMRGRVNVSFEDVDRVVLPALNHRVILSFEAEADKRTAVDILGELTEPLRAAR